MPIGSIIIKMQRNRVNKLSTYNHDDCNALSIQYLRTKTFLNQRGYNTGMEKMKNRCAT